MIVFGEAQASYALAIALVGAFAMGHCGVIVLVGTAAQKAQTVVSLGGRSGVTKWVRRICGALVCLAGVNLLATR